MSSKDDENQREVEGIILDVRTPEPHQPDEDMEKIMNEIEGCDARPGKSIKIFVDVLIVDVLRLQQYAKTRHTIFNPLLLSVLSKFPKLSPLIA